jgi:hypothetical protein
VSLCVFAAASIEIKAANVFPALSDTEQQGNIKKSAGIQERIHRNKRTWLKYIDREKRYSCFGLNRLDKTQFELQKLKIRMKIQIWLQKKNNEAYLIFLTLGLVSIVVICCAKESKIKST